jgi:hypothetical protein
MIAIAFLADYPETIPTLSCWFRDQWPKYYAERTTADIARGFTLKHIASVYLCARWPSPMVSWWVRLFWMTRLLGPCRNAAQVLEGYLSWNDFEAEVSGPN